MELKEKKGGMISLKRGLKNAEAHGLVGVSKVELKA